MNIGDVITWKRTFTEEDIQRYGRLSGDEGIHHIQTDGQGRLMAQGLFTATLPTKIGGDLSFVAHEMTFTFLRPVYANDTIDCQVTITDLHEERGLMNVSSNWTCLNQRAKEVMKGHAVGFLRR
jgi:3-hydroxybutyryl-CoA dehydratase